MQGTIVNPRGGGGAGKTELVRRIMSAYGAAAAEPVYRAGREKPICCRLRHPLAGRPLVVLGHYEVTSGGCDTIRHIDEVFRLASDYASDDHDVLFEGLMVSREYERTAALAAAHDVHILLLRTPPDQCARNLIRRRRARRDAHPFIASNATAEHHAVDETCARLRWCANVEALDFDSAFVRTLQLLGFGLDVPGDGAAGGS